MTICKHKTMTM